jgi:hypothetical protein
LPNLTDFALYLTSAWLNPTQRIKASKEGLIPADFIKACTFYLSKISKPLPYGGNLLVDTLLNNE